MAQTTMMIRTCKIRRGDVIVEPVPYTDHPYREVVVTGTTAGEILYEGRWVQVKYIAGTDVRTQCAVHYTGTEYRMWQVIREQ